MNNPFADLLHTAKYIYQELEILLGLIVFDEGQEFLTFVFYQQFYEQHLLLPN